MLRTVQLSATFWTSCHALQPMGCFRQEYCSALPFSPPGDLRNPGIKPKSALSPALQADSLHAELLLLLLLSCFSHVRLCATPWTVAYQAPPSLGFSRQEHWSGLPFPSPMHESEKWKWSRSVVSNSVRPRGLQPSPPGSPVPPGKDTGAGCPDPAFTYQCFG